jgi:hypothetical protein
VKNLYQNAFRTSQGSDKKFIFLEIHVKMCIIFFVDENDMEKLLRILGLGISIVLFMELFI